MERSPEIHVFSGVHAPHNGSTTHDLTTLVNGILIYSLNTNLDLRTKMTVKTHKGTRGGRYYMQRKKGGGTKRTYLKKGQRPPC